MYSSHAVRRGCVVVGTLWFALSACTQHSDESHDVVGIAAALSNATTVSARGDTYIRSLAPNENDGADTLIRLQSPGASRGLVFFTPSAIRAVVGASRVASASLQFTLDGATDIRSLGQPIAVHRLLQASSEYTATWNCANDGMIYNWRADCSGVNAWNMDASSQAQPPWLSPASATATILDNQRGTVSFDVTADVSALMSNAWGGFGWLIKKVDESQRGVIAFNARERANGPRLVLQLTTNPPDAGVSDAGVQHARLPASADTEVWRLTPDQNFSYDNALRVQSLGRGRGLVQFDMDALRNTLGADHLTGAKLELTITHVYDICTADHVFGAHRVTQAWTESGATWNCANDTVPNFFTNCSAADRWAPNQSIVSTDAPSATATIDNHQSGAVSFDVSHDIACALAGYRPLYGFLIKKELENQGGRVDFASRETNTPPVLSMDFGPGAGLAVTAADCGVSATDAGTPPDAGNGCVPTAETDTTCNGVDDDCDGQIDDDYNVSATQCGSGSCQASGSLSCVNGHVVDSCVATQPAATDATCDGLDDDCDGHVDEDYASHATSCGVGACASAGTASCVAGHVTDSCVAGTAAASDATCDGVDDDCDGHVDDDYVAVATSCGVGACGAVGSLSCVSGSLQDSCLALPPASNDASCNGADDDCDGRSDEDFEPACTSGGASSCVGGLLTVSSCDDGNACTSDGCNSGACSHAAVSCDDGNGCTLDSCDAAIGCGHVANTGASCNDLDACTVADSCSTAGVCRGNLVDPDDQNPCTDDSCDVVLGVQHVAAAGRACSDNDACSTGDSCNAAGACVATGTRNCSDGVFCNGLEGCNPATGCTAGVAPDVDDGIGCTADHCDEASASVVHQPNDALCSDSSVCTGDEHCSPTAGCMPGTPLVTDDGNACTADACDPQSGVSHSNLALGTSCGSSQYCDDVAHCLTFTQCASNLVVASGQNLSFTGPCEINSITFNGGSLTINGALKTPSITMASGGTLKVNAGVLITGAIALSNGTIDIGGTMTGTLTQSGGTFTSRGQFSPASNGFSLNAGTFTNMGTLRLSTFDGSDVHGGTLNNRGRLDIASDVLTVAAGVTFNESGSLGASDSIGQLTVSGTLLHDTGYAPGVAFSVSGDAAITSTGKIDVSRRGLLGYAGPNDAGAGQSYVFNGTQWVVTNGIGGTTTGGSHGGIGTGVFGQSAGPANDTLSTPVLLGSGGGGSDTFNAQVGGNGGGRVDIVIAGRLTVDGSIVAGGGSAASQCGGGAGGSVRLRVGTLQGAGSISANGGNGSGGGGGGRIAIEYGTKSYTGTLQAIGAAGAGAGTIYLKSSATPLAELTIDNAGAGASSTPISSSDGPFAKVTLSGNASSVLSNSQSSNWVVSGGSLTLSGDSAGSAYAVSSGALTFIGNVTPANLVVSGTGSVNNAATLTLSSSALQLNAGTFTNTGTVTMPVFDGTSLHGGSFINRGRLDIANDVLTIPAGVTMSESGTLGSSDSIGQLNVVGTLTHESQLSAGLSFIVAGDATIAASGKIDVSRRGLAGYTGPNNAGAGQSYIWNGAQWVLTTSVGGTAAGGSHGGLGTGEFGQIAAPINDTPAAPVLLGDGGGGSDVGNGLNGGNGGGRVDLVVTGKLTVAGSIAANGGNAPSHCGAGAGGSIRLRVNRLEGAGLITANGGNASGSGGGGLIAVDYITKSYTGAYQVLGLNGAGAGTVTEHDLTANPVSATPQAKAHGATLCQLTTNGAIECSGSDAFGIVSQAPIQAYNRLAIGPSAACALHAAGMVDCWGSVAASGLYNEPVDALSDVAVSRLAACAVRLSNGSLVCWGDDSDHIVSSKPSSGQFSAVYMADRTACAKRVDGTLVCWGDDTTSAVSSVPSAAISSAAGGDGFFCAVKADSSLLCWGSNAYGQSMPNAGSYSAVTTGRRHACALDASGVATCWGDNSFGESQALAGNYVSLAAGEDFTCGLTATGELSCWGNVPAGL